MWGEDRVRVYSVVWALFSFSSMSLRHPLWGRVWVCKLNPTLASFGGRKGKRASRPALPLRVRFGFWASGLHRGVWDRAGRSSLEPEDAEGECATYQAGVPPLLPRGADPAAKGLTAASQVLFSLRWEAEPPDPEAIVWQEGKRMITPPVPLFQIGLLIPLLRTSQGCRGDPSSSPSEWGKSPVCIVHLPR